METRYNPVLMTDKYEYTMLSAMVLDGTVDNKATFELFARRLPKGRRYGVVGGLGRLIDYLKDFKFDKDTIDFLLETNAINEPTVQWLKNFKFSGDIWAYPEGQTYYPYSPLLTVTGTLGECIFIETLALSILNADSAVAAAAARMVVAAGERPIIEMGSRRTNEEAAVAAARIAYIEGFSASSNMLADARYGVPSAGTAAHAFTLAHRDEKAAFASQVAALGVGTTLLVDTYDIEQGIRNAVEVAGTELGAIRIDSGDLGDESYKARKLLDELGATKTRIVISSDVDEYSITALKGSPIDAFGAGTRVVTGSGHPTCGMVYKLVEVSSKPDGQMNPVAKKSADKISVGGFKTAYRYPDGREFYSLDGTVPEGAKPLQVQVVKEGSIVHDPSLDEVRTFAAQVLADLPAEARQVADGEPVCIVTTEGGTE